MLMRGGTKRDETRSTDGEIVSRTAGMLGKPLLPWQRYVADVAGEIVAAVRSGALKRSSTEMSSGSAMGNPFLDKLVRRAGVAGS